MLFLKMGLTKMYLFLTCTICADFFGVRATNLNMEEETPLSMSRINDQQLGIVSCPKKSIHVLLPHPTDCRKFFTCDYGVAHPTSCQKGLHFNEKLQACDYPENAECEADVNEVPRGRDGDELNALCPSEKSKHPILKPHSSDCGKFYICDGGTAHLKVCHPGLHFNTKTQTCDYPRNAKCDSSVVTEKPLENTGGCPAVNNGNPVLLPHKTDCRKFYICDQGVPHLKICQAGLHFNPKVQACDYPANAGCGPDLSKKDPTAKGRLGDFSVCPNSQNGEMVLVPHPDDCTKFYFCYQGQKYARKCPSGLHFSTALQACDYPEKAQCENKGRLLSVGVPSPLCPTIEGKVPVFYRHPSNCSLYFMCSNGFAYKFQCPARLHFNLEQKICDYESAANCLTEITCLDPGADQNFRVIPTQPHLRKVGDLIIFKCKYTSYQTSAKCLKTGEWSKRPPVCPGNL